ncbi:MAG TPA: Crp/Fnr family transcriptional regulator [Pyrinomonadaceae bacterium]
MQRPVCLEPQKALGESMRASANSPQLARCGQLQNRILSSLPPDEYDHIVPNLEPVKLAQGKVLYHAGDTLQYGYFINTGQVSLLSTTEEGTSIEVAVTGREGVIGIPLILRSEINSYEVIAQIPVEAVRIRADVLRSEFERGGKLSQMMLRYIQVMLTQITQSVICNRFHTSEQRLARSLLASLDQGKSDTINLTHEVIAHTLGTRRTRVTMAARVLQKAVLIDYSRGKITVLDREGLENAACECYKVLREDCEHFLKALRSDS